MSGAELAAILVIALVAAASPGPATLAISATSMAQGRRVGLALASGVLTGSLMWSSSAALGLAALMAAHGWLIEAFRYVAGAYLLWLAWRSARSAMHARAPIAVETPAAVRAAYLRGLGLHLTNPKAIFFFGALYTVGLPVGATAADVFTIFLSIACLSATVFLGYAVLFSLAPARRVYARARRPFEAVAATLFGAAGISLLLRRAA